MRTSRKLVATITTAAVVTGAIVACGGGNRGPLALDAVQACSALSGQAVAGARVTSVNVVAETAVVPKHCNVALAVDPSLNVEMRIPDSWNGKLHYYSEQLQS